jgi:hemerythrin-like metal-binding protein
MPIHWTAAMETGIRKIDLQHHELIDIINELEWAHERGEAEMAMAEILPRLRAYVVFHFSEEEVLASGFAAGTPHLRRHLDEHRKFAETMASMTVEDEADAARIIDYLKDWIVTHITKIDRSLAAIYHGSRRPAEES